MTRKSITVFGDKLQLLEVLPDEDPAMSIVRYLNKSDPKPQKAKVCTLADWREWDKNAMRAASVKDIDDAFDGSY